MACCGTSVWTKVESRSAHIAKPAAWLKMTLYLNLEGTETLTPLSLSRPEPHGASFRLPGEGQPHAELLLQQRGGRGEDVEASGRELRPEARWDRRHERRLAALRESEHGGLQHPRPLDPLSADREARRGGVALLGRVGQQRDGGGCRAAGQQQFSQPAGLSIPVPISVPALRQRLNTCDGTWTWVCDALPYTCM